MLEINNALVLMIDFQEKLVSSTDAQSESLNSAKLLSAAKILDIPVVVTEQYPKGLGSTIEQVKSVMPDNTMVFEKTAFSAMKETFVADAIKKTGRKQVLLFGIELHICVYQTAMELLAQGYEVFIVKDACKSRSDYNFEAGLDLLKSKGATITTLEILLFELLQSSKHPNFKEIQALIK